MIINRVFKRIETTFLGIRKCTGNFIILFVATSFTIKP